MRDHKQNNQTTNRVMIAIVGLLALALPSLVMAAPKNLIAKMNFNHTSGKFVIEGTFDEKFNGKCDTTLVARASRGTTLLGSKAVTVKVKSTTFKSNKKALVRFLGNVKFAIKDLTTDISDDPAINVQLFATCQIGSKKFSYFSNAAAAFAICAPGSKEVSPASFLSKLKGLLS